MISVTPPVELRIDTGDGEQFLVELRHDRWAGNSGGAQVMIPIPLNQKVFIDPEQPNYHFDALDLNTQLAWAVIEDGLKQGALFDGQVMFEVLSSPALKQKETPAAFIYQVVTPDALCYSETEDDIISEVDFLDPVIAEMVAEAFPGTGVHVKAVEPQQVEKKPQSVMPLAALAQGAVAWARRTYDIADDVPVAGLLPQLNEALSDYPSSIRDTIISAASHVNALEGFEKALSVGGDKESLNTQLILPFLSRAVLSEMKQLDPVDVDRFLPLVPAGMEITRQQQKVTIGGKDVDGVGYYAAERHSKESGILFCLTEKCKETGLVNLYSGIALERLVKLDPPQPSPIQAKRVAPENHRSITMKRS